MRFGYENYLDDATLSAESEYSTTFPVKNIIDRRLGKRTRSFRNPNLMLYGNCDSANAPTLDGTPYAVSNGTYAIDEDMKYEGTGSWCMTKISAAGGGDARAYFCDGVGTADLHGLTIGKTYEVILRARYTGTGAPSVFYFREYFSATWNNTLILAVAASNNWQYLHGKITIRSATTGIYPFINIASAQEAGVKLYVDSIKFFESNDLIEYGHCESTDSPTLDGTPDAAINCTWARSNTTAYLGTYSWMLNKTTAAGAGAATQWLNDNSAATDDMHGMVAGKTYLFKGAIYRHVLANAALSGLYFYEYYAAAWNATKIFVPVNANAWETFSKTITINPATTGIRWRLYMDTNEDVNKRIYIDEFEVLPETRLTFDLYSAKTPKYICIGGHNLSSSATVKVEANTTATWTTPAVSESITLAEFMHLFIANGTAYHYWSVVFSDFDYNEDGYVEVGYIGLGTYWQPAYGPARVFSETPQEKSINVESETGENYGTDGILLNEWDVNIPWFTIAEVNNFKTMYDAVKNHTPFLFVLDENNLTYFPAKYVKIVDYTITHIMQLQKYSMVIRIKESK